MGDYGAFSLFRPDNPLPPPIDPFQSSILEVFPGSRASALPAKSSFLPRSGGEAQDKVQAGVGRLSCQSAKNHTFKISLLRKRWCASVGAAARCSGQLMVNEFENQPLHFAKRTNKRACAWYGDGICEIRLWGGGGLSLPFALQ